MAILEGMSHGIPVIASTVGSIPEVITDGENGFLVEPGDVAALADRMKQLADDAKLRRRMGAAARKRVEKEFSIDAMTDRIIGIYREILERD